MSLSETTTLSDEDLQHAWSQDGLHFGHPLSPMVASYMVPAMTEGTRSAMGTLKSPVRQSIGAPGRHVGPVRVVQGSNEFFKVQPDGILSHAATVAREYKIPCVVGTREATRVFHDGDIVAVDGTRGTAVVNG